MDDYKVERGNGRIVITFYKAPSRRIRNLLKNFGYSYHAQWKCWIGRKNLELLEEMIGYHEEKAEIARKQFGKRSQTLCWKCKKTNENLCSWFTKEAKPVNGWNAIYDSVHDSYCVLECPNFSMLRC